MDDDSGQFKPPPVGSFPFFEKAVELTSIWTKSMTGQANLWNEQWSKIKAGKYRAEDWYSAVVSSTEMTASMLGELFVHAMGDPTPPWCSLRGNSKDEVLVQLRMSLAEDDSVSVSGMSLIGGSQPEHPPQIEVTRLEGDARVIKLWLSDKVTEFPAGQYIAFVTRTTSPEPIAIVTLNHDPSQSVEDPL